MPDFKIVEAKQHHCGQMARKLRSVHCRAISDFDVHREIVNSFNQSSFRKGWMVDDVLCGVGGVIGTLISPIGFVWLCLSDEAMKYPVHVARESIKQLNEIMLIKSELTTLIVRDDIPSLKFAYFLGFKACGEELGGRLIKMVYAGRN